MKLFEIKGLPNLKCPDCEEKLKALDYDKDEEGATHKCRICGYWLITKCRDED